jgi:hypothetical protein
MNGFSTQRKRRVQTASMGGMPTVAMRRKRPAWFWVGPSHWLREGVYDSISDWCQR